MDKEYTITFTNANKEQVTIELGCCYVVDSIIFPRFLLKYTSNGHYKTAFGDITYKHLESIDMFDGNVMTKGIAGYVLSQVKSIRKIPNEIYDKAKKAHDTYMSALGAIATQIPNEQPTNEQVSQS